MKIKTKLQIITFLAVAVIAAAGAVAFLSTRQAQRISQEEIFADKIVEQIFWLRTLTYDYLLHRTERARKQWWAVYDDLGRLLASRKFQAAVKSDALQEVIAKYELVDDVFLRLLENYHKKETHREKTALFQEVENRLVGQLLQETQTMVSLVFQLTEEIHQAMAVWQRRTTQLQIGSLLLVCLIIGANAYFMVRSIALPIFKLRQGVNIIGAGNLDYRLGSQARDEIGQLSRAFDEMTANLRQITVSRDELEKEVAARMAAEEKLQHAVLELSRSNTELEQFAYVASHDLQEPLRMVASFTQLLAQRYRGQLDDKADEFIGFAVDGANRMQRLINDLLAYSRVGTRGQPFQPTDLEAVWQQVLANLQLAVEESGAVITHDPLPTVQADASQMAQLFQNLIGNAIKFQGTETPRIHLAPRRQGEWWLFSVKDNGIGIDPEFQNRIFDIFQRLHARTEYPGTGIGLAICKKIVERHGGHIRVESALGQGATFFFTLPVTAGA